VIPIFFLKKNETPHLDSGVRKLYKALTGPDNARRREAADSILALDAGAISAVLKAVDSEDDPVKSAAFASLADAGARHFPALIDVMELEDPGVQNIAEKVISLVHDSAALPDAVNAFRSTSVRGRKAAQEFCLRSENTDTVFELLLKALKDNDVNSRRIASETLGSLGETRVIPHLISALMDPSPEVVEGAAWALGEIGPPALGALKKALESPHRDLRKNALSIIIGIGSARSIPDIIGSLQSDDQDIRWKAAEALGSLRTPKAIGPLIECLRDRDRDMRRIASSSLAEIGKPAIPVLIATLSDKSSFVREGAQRALADIGDNAVPDLIKSLKKANPAMQGNILHILEEMADHSVDILIKNLRDTDPFIRSEIIRILGKTGNEELIAPLTKMMRDPDKDVRLAAATALGNYGKAVIGAVLKFAEKNQDHSLYEVSLVLNRVCTRNSTEIIEALQNKYPEVRRIAARALGTAKSISAVPHLIEGLTDESKLVRESSAWALGETGDPRAIAPLVRELCDSSQKEQSPGVMWAIAKIKDDSAAPLLIKALEDEAPFVRVRAAAVLGMMRETRAVDTLISLMDDPSVEVRNTAVTALGNIGDSKAEPHLLRAMETTSGDEWNTLRNALINLRKHAQDQSCIIPPRKK